jgi:hypothetical protein
MRALAFVNRLHTCGLPGTDHRRRAFDQRAGSSDGESVELGRISRLRSLNIERVAPALFSADGSGHGIAAAVAVRCGTTGCQVQPASNRSPAGCRARPIDIGGDASVFVSLVGTVFRGRTPSVFTGTA